MISSTLWFAALVAGWDAMPEERHLAVNKFTIPFRIAADRRPQVREVLLYLSRDRGRSWQVVARTNPNQEGFPYQAFQDGPHWFSVALLDANNRQEPLNIYTAPVGQKLVVDTTKPEAKLWANRNNQEISIQWDIREEHINLNTVRLECRTSEMPAEQWIPIQIRPSLNGTGSFPAPTGGSVQVRLHAADVAGNQMAVLAEAAGNSAFGAVSPTLAAGSAPAPSLGFGQGANTYPSGPLVTNTPQPAVGSSTSYAPVSPVASPFENTPMQGGGLTPATATGIRTGFQDSMAMARPQVKPVQMVAQRHASVEIELGKVGPSGIGAVEVWTTLDEGATWSLASTETVSENPMDGALRKTSATRYKIPVQLEREGVPQGFTLIAKSRAGLGRAAPTSGEPPQIRLECDSTAPEATLFNPIPDRDSPNQLMLTWKVTDKNLTNQPVVLEWADQPAGPWQKIGSGELNNSGKYSWAVPPGTPHSVYLRLTAKDLAGNKAVAQTHQPILVDLSVPEVNILGVTQGK